jgi:hypothetical protein
MQEWIVPVALGVLGVVAVALGLALARTRRRTRAEITAARAETAALRHELEELHRRVAGSGGPVPRETPEYRITELGDSAGATPPADHPSPVDRTLFADLVLRETVVKAAGLAHGVRRALSPETRNRVRFEVRREVRRSRKQRRADLKEARREWAARGRADSGDEFAA